MKHPPLTKGICLTVGLRLFLGPLVLWSPWVSLVTFVVDWLDGEVFKRSGWTHARYDQVDKLLDLYFYAWIMTYILTFNLPPKFLFLFFFALRLLGQLIFYLSKNDKAFFFFPNIYEILFYFYLFTLIIPPLAKYLLFPWLWLTLAIITIIVLIREYVLHIQKANLSWMVFGKITHWPDRT
ncbi:hypothetical protein A2160_05605 [Candidatus Beckwithbacteria bacterium RBG_13_42_9]|uniref:CDP-alcohol phosphatidyltransferase n=1 Tax=Candidatus Beckwithbacteria bacterium RBG_13_42_9 TaxID=1797457 RepID=A0A1F5E5Z3_9BACT|nr:MAG: hypothetical protein A2160_05605 [Candidatus Beckwithbacteria bacterium RBG_13_42_9]